MRFHGTIEATDDAENPMWYPVIACDEPEEYDGTSAQYGRDVLENWITDQTSLADQDPPRLTDDYGNPYLRVVVRFSDEPDAHDERIAIVGAGDLDAPPAELDAVDAARDAKLYVKHLDALADDQLEEALQAANAAGHPRNYLAARVHPAVSRPIALRMMQTPS